VVKKGITRNNVDPKVLREGRYLMMPLLHKKKPLQMKEGMCTFLSSRTHVYHEAWLVDSSASFHMTPHRDWFCEYERYDGGNVFRRDKFTTKIVGRGKVKLKLMDVRIRALPVVLHIPGLAKNLTYVSKMDNTGVKMVFEKEICKMARRAMVLLRGVWIGTLYKLLGSTISDGCNSSIVPEIGAEEGKSRVVYREKTMLWHQTLGYIGEKGIQAIHGKGC
jgi:hypothetical protein